jgi:GNAT superfamily N-acetyltransferase
MEERLETIRKLEQCMLNSWPSTRTVHCDGWVFRQAGRYTKRANSAHAIAPSSDLPSVLNKAQEFYAAHRQPAVFRLTPLAGACADAILRRQGFACVDPTIVMAAPLEAASVDTEVEIQAGYTEDWFAAHAAARGLTLAEADGHRIILQTIALPMAFATWRVNDEPLAFGLAVLDFGHLGLFDIVTTPSARRRGGARKIVSALRGWGKSLGAHTAWLSVLADNAPAIALYENLKFEEAYRYHYRVE